MKSRALLILVSLSACHDGRIEAALGLPPLPAESTGALTEAPTSTAPAASGR